MFKLGHAILRSNLERKDSPRNDRLLSVTKNNKLGCLCDSSGKTDAFMYFDRGRLGNLKSGDAEYQTRTLGRIGR